MANEQPITKSYLPLGNFNSTISGWSSGDKSVQLQVDQRLRERPLPPESDTAEDQERYTNALKKFESFQKYGRVDLYSSDAMNLIAIARALLPPTARITVEL